MSNEELLRVCLISRHFNLKTGGIGRYSMEILNALQSYADVSIKKICEDMFSVPYGEALSKRIPQYHVVKYALYTAIYLRNALQGYECDVYHFLSPIEFAYVPRKMIHKKPTIVTFHDIINFREVVQGSPMKLSKRIFMLYTFHKLRKNLSNHENIIIISINQELKEELHQLFGVNEGKIRVIPNGISNSLNPGQKKDCIHRIGTLSYLSPRKRIDLLISSYLNSSHDGELWIGGSTLDKAYLRCLRSISKNDKRIKFLGFIPDERLGEFYNSLDVFIFPSRAEGWGIPIVEALACGKPVVTLSDADIPWEVQKHTYIVNPRELTSIIENPPKKPRRRDVEWAQSLKWKSIAKRVVRVYKELLE